MDGELDYIELFDQYARGHIDYSELAQSLMQEGVFIDVDTELHNYRLALECLHMGYLKMQLNIIHNEIMDDLQKDFSSE